jgi:hypothetical protein
MLVKTSGVNVAAEVASFCYLKVFEWAFEGQWQGLVASLLLTSDI